MKHLISLWEIVNHHRVYIVINLYAQWKLGYLQIDALISELRRVYYFDVNDLYNICESC